MIPTAADLVVFALFLLPLAGVLSYAWRFRNVAEAQDALERARADATGFRWAVGLLLVGVAVLAEGQAVKWVGGFTMGNPWLLGFHVTGYVLVALGFLRLHRVLGPDPWE